MASCGASGSAIGDDDDDEGTDEDEPPVQIHRAEFRSHRPVVVSEVPVYVCVKEKSGRLFEDRGECRSIRYRWMRGPVIKPCVFHPHKTSQFRDVTKTFQYYCSKECFLRGWHTLPEAHWNDSKEVEDFPSEDKTEWVEIAGTRTYCPTSQDIDRPLRLDIIPLMEDGSDAIKGGMSITTGTVIPTPKEARTRRMISNGGQFNAEWLSKQFKVMNWNVLADLYTNEHQYPYCEKWALSWTWRKHLIVKELKSMTADIITLQEVQKDAFEEWFKPELAEAGYEGAFQSKRREPVFHKGKYTVEGCATFFKTTRFRRVDKHTFDYDKISANTRRAGQVDGDRGLPRWKGDSAGNIALVMVLEDLTLQATQDWQAKGAGGGHKLCVVNTHILADTEATDVKLWQVHLMLQSLESTQLKDMPLLVCGDFNSTPDSAVYEYLCQGLVRREHSDLVKLKSDPCGLVDMVEAGHSLRLATAYESCNGKEAAYTNYTEDFKGTLDYIFFSSELLAVLAVSQVDDESQLSQEVALPSSTRPSDHLSLVATFMFREQMPVHNLAGQVDHAQHHYARGYAVGGAGASGPGADAQVFVPAGHGFEPFAAGGWVQGGWAA